LHVAISYDTVPVEFDQLFNASEKRLARTLLLLARFGKPDGPRRVLPRISQERDPLAMKQLAFSTLLEPRSVAISF
jgi:hypothetical protein